MSTIQPAGQESPYAGAIAAELARAPRHLAPEVALAIGVLMGPLPGSESEDAA